MNSQANEIRSPIIASWVLLIATCILAAIPFIGFLSWIIGGVTVTIAIILAIVAIAKGGTWSGIFVLLAALIVVPLVVIFAPIISSAVTAAILDEKSGPGDPAPAIEMTEDPEKAAADSTIEGDIQDSQEDSVEAAAPASRDVDAVGDSPPKDNG